MPLKNRQNHPPGGGYSFYQPETRWMLKGGLPFDQAVREIVQHRRANPAFNLQTDPVLVADELDAYTCKRLKDDPNWVEKKTPEIPSDSSSWIIPTIHPQSLLAAAPVAEKGSGLLKRAGQIADGIGTLASWVGNGAEPVTQQEADRRAFVCTTAGNGGGMCPKNVQGNWVDYITGGIANAIKSALSLKTHLKLTTQLDEKLGTCDACGCDLRLKVWVPADEIKRSLTPEILDECVPKCWMRKL